MSVRRTIGRERPPLHECVQFWDIDWMQAQVRSAHVIKRQRLLQRRGVELSYEGSARLRRKSTTIALLPVVAAILLFILAGIGMKNRWLSGGEKGVFGCALEGGCEVETNAVEAAPIYSPAPDSAWTEWNPDVDSGGLGEGFAIDLTTPNESGVMGIPTAAPAIGVSPDGG